MLRELQAGDPHFIGPYRLRGLLGVGGMGRVFLGVSPEGQPVAVKVIRADLASDHEFRARFRREVTVARRVSSHFTAPVVGADASLDRVPAEVRALIERCLAKDPGQRPTAHDVLAAAGTVQPTVGWLPVPVTRTFVQLPTRADPPRTVTSLVGPALAEPVPVRRRDARTRAVGAGSAGRSRYRQ